MAEATPQAASRRLLNATALMASGTLISRVLGFAKATLLIIVLGAANPQAEAFTLATLVPNSLYMLVAGGALNTVLVPQIVRHIRSDDDGGEAFINRIMTAFIAALAVVTIVATVFTPWVMALWTDSAWRAPDMADHWQMLVWLAYLTMPQLFFYGAFFLIGQVLNARDKFGPMMWAPILNNVVGIAVLGLYLAIWGANRTDGVTAFTVPQVVVLGVGLTLGIVLQTAALIPSLRAIGFRYRPRWDLKGQGLGQTFHLAKWMLGYVLLTTIVQIVVSRLASAATVMVADSPGAGITAYNTAYLVWILPHSLLTVSLATAMLPSASRLAASHDYAGVAAETTRTLRLALTFLVPSSLAFVALGLPFSQLVFGHGATTETWPFIGWTLVAFAVGLIPYTVQYVYLRGFYALEDTRTPFYVQIGISVVNIIVAIGLIVVDANPLTIAPRLALAYSISYLVGAWLTHRALRRQLPRLAAGPIIQHTVQLIIATLPGAVIAALLSWWASGRGTLVVLATFIGSIVLAAGLFFLGARRLGIKEMTELSSVLRRRTVPADEGAPVSSEEAMEALDDADAALLAYPEPGTEAASAPVEVGPHTSIGDILDRRYRLDQPLNRRGATVTWRGWDLNLSRPVLLHVMDPGEGRVLDILDQARQAAPAVDSRFLRVWDAVLDESGEHGSYIVCEYAPGQSLELALQQGPLTDAEAAWVVREVASALTGMHAQGLQHRQLNPDTVVITASGSVKIVGFLVEHALHPNPSCDDPVRADVLALGQLLYASLTGRWPGPARYGLPAAPTDAHGRPYAPRQVNRSVSLELSDITDRILSPTPQGRATPLTTADAIAAALTAVLAGTDASRALAQRLSHPIAPVRLTGAPAPAVPAGAAGTLSLSERLPVDADAVVDSLDDEPTGPLHTRADDRPASPWGNPASDDDDDADADVSTQAFWLDDLTGDDEDEPSVPFTPIPPPRTAVTVSAPAPSQDPPRRWMGVLLAAFILVLVVSLGVVFVQQFQRSRATTPQPSTPYALVAAQDFDPSGDGGDGRENPEQARFVMDGDTATAWTTERYGRSATFNGRKPGAGVVVDLGEVKDVSWVTVDVGSGPTSVDIRVPADAEVTSPPMDSESQWRRVDGFTASTGAVQVHLADTVRTRWILVYITSMPRDGANWVGRIQEIRVSA